MEPIPLTSLLPEDLDPTQFKVHFAVWNQINASDRCSGDQPRGVAGVELLAKCEE